MGNDRALTHLGTMLWGKGNVVLGVTHQTEGSTGDETVQTRMQLTGTVCTHYHQLILFSSA